MTSTNTNGETALSRKTGSALTPDEWDTLAWLGTMTREAMSPIGRDNYATLLAETQKEYAHPENYDGPCECRLCMSYADEPNIRDQECQPTDESKNH